MKKFISVLAVVSFLIACNGRVADNVSLSESKQTIIDSLNDAIAGQIVTDSLKAQKELKAVQVANKQRNTIPDLKKEQEGSGTASGTVQ